MFANLLFVELLVAICFAKDIISSVSHLDVNINMAAGAGEEVLSNATATCNDTLYGVDIEERVYFGKKPNWNIWSCLEYNYSQPEPTPISGSPQSEAISLEIVTRAFVEAGVDFSKYEKGVSYIIDLDLSHMVERIIYEKAFESIADCNFAINEYKKFLILYLYLTATSNVAASDDYLMVPSVLVDELWHWHVLDVERYIFDCMQICGHIIPHSGRNTVANGKWLARFDQVLAAYNNVFGYASPTETVSNCGLPAADSEPLPSAADTTFNLQIKEIDINVLNKSFTFAGIDFGGVEYNILRLIDLDLSAITPRLMAEMGYKNEEECNFALTEYKKFLILYMYLRGVSLTGDYVEFGNFVPPFPVDLVWHAHIMDLKQYIADSRDILGDVFYHNPRFHLRVEQFPSVQTPKYAILWETYPKIFGYRPPFPMWGDDASIAAQCCGGGPQEAPSSLPTPSA